MFYAERCDWKNWVSQPQTTCCLETAIFKKVNKLVLQLMVFIKELMLYGWFQVFNNEFNDMLLSFAFLPNFIHTNTVLILHFKHLLYRNIAMV